MLGLIAAGLGLGRAGLGAIQANQTKQRNKGLIAQAYRQGRARLDTGQADARQSGSEGLIARGLTQGGAGGSLGPVAPGARVDLGGAHDLGSQQQLDQRSEQGLAQTELKTQADTAQQDNRAQYTSNLIGSAVAGAETGMGVYSAGQTLQGLRGGARAGLNPTTPSMSQTTQAGGIPGWGGIDAIDPLRRGAWAAPSTGSFNIFTPRAGGMY